MGGWEIKLQTNPKGPLVLNLTHPEHLYIQNCVPPPKLTQTHTHMQEWKLAGKSHASGTLRQDIPCHSGTDLPKATHVPVPLL